MACTLLVARQDEIEVGGLVDGIEDGENGAAGISEDVFDTMAQHHLVENLATRKTNKRVIQRSILRGADVWRRQTSIAGGWDLLEARSW
jgi:hypothetical protein